MGAHMNFKSSWVLLIEHTVFCRDYLVSFTRKILTYICVYCLILMLLMGMKMSFIIASCTSCDSLHSRIDGRVYMALCLPRLLLRWRYSPGWALASFTIRLQVSRSLALSVHSFIPIFLRSVDTSSSHLIFGLPLRLVAYSFPYNIFLRIAVSFILSI